MSMEMNRNWVSGCRGESAMKVFLDDLARARAAYVDADQLKITLANNEGTIYFQREK